METDNELFFPSPQRTHYRIWPLEFSIVCLFLATELSTASILTNQLIYQTCTVTLGYNVSDCKLLGTQNESSHIRNLEAEAQHHVTIIQMTRVLIESLIPAILSLFIGPWSDKFGRKPVMMASFYGYIAMYIALCFITFMSNMIPVSPWFYLLGSVFVTFGGGMCSIITGVFAFCADVTSESKRESR